MTVKSHYASVCAHVCIYASMCILLSTTNMYIHIGTFTQYTHIYRQLYKQIYAYIPLQLCSVLLHQKRFSMFLHKSLGLTCEIHARQTHSSTPIAQYNTVQYNTTT